MKKIAVFELTDPSDKKKYEELLNDPLVTIYDREFAYDRNGVPKLVIWYDIEV
jgi:hypothetical protein